MKVGCCSIKFVLHGNRSLKDKRRILRTLKDRVKNKFNISVAEVGDQDLWNRMHIGVAAAGSDARYLEGLLTQVVNFVEEMQFGAMTDYHIEVIHLGEDY